MWLKDHFIFLPQDTHSDLKTEMLLDWPQFAETNEAIKNQMEVPRITECRVFKKDMGMGIIGRGGEMWDKGERCETSNHKLNPLGSCH